MSLSNPAAWFAVCALCLLIGAALARSSGFFRERLADGLRGFLALGVFGVHAVNMYTLHASGVWATGIAPFYSSAARAGVALFFVITGFLFWLRVLRAGDAFDTRAFFVSRLRRLTPMYAMSVLMVLAVVAAASGFVPRESPVALARELRPWLSFGFMETGPLNGVADAHYVNAVYWTLAYEWMFYVALPFLALFARGPKGGVALAAAVLVFGAQAPIVYNFLFGALAAWLVHRRMLAGRLDSPWLAPVPLAALAVYFAAPGMHGLAQAAALFVFFVFVVHGYSVLGLLRTRPAQFLGMISYSIYLTHCIALFATVRAVDALVPVASLDAVQYWLLAALAAAGCIALSALTYRFVEYPFIHPQRAPRQPAAAASQAAP
jgi:peptidoglycan/LPS O-acetylase OafA/YrhL